MKNEITKIMEICDNLKLECTCAYNEFSDTIETIKFNINNTYYTYNEALVRLKLMQEFENMNRMPIFEINLKDYYEDLEEDEYEIFTLYINEKGIGVYHSDIFEEWDRCFSLDEHIQAIYEKVIETLYQYNEKPKEISDENL